MKEALPYLSGGGFVLIGGILGALIKGWLDGKKDTRDSRQTAVWTWREGLAHWEREAARLNSMNVRPPDIQREAWFTSFATHADPAVLERVSARYGKAWIREPSSKTYSAREDFAEEIQREIASIAKKWNIA